MGHDDSMKNKTPSINARQTVSTDCSSLLRLIHISALETTVSAIRKDPVQLKTTSSSVVKSCSAIRNNYQHNQKRLQCNWIKLLSNTRTPVQSKMTASAIGISPRAIGNGCWCSWSLTG